MWRAVLSAGADGQASLLLGDLGEVLMASGGNRDAELILRSVLRDQKLPKDVSASHGIAHT